jgi:hypothetical protein
MAVGLIGLFIGPVIMATVLAAWREWIDRNEAFRKAIGPTTVDTWPQKARAALLTQAAPSLGGNA